MPSFSQRRLNAVKRNLKKKELKEDNTDANTVSTENTESVKKFIKRSSSASEHKYWGNKPVMDYSQNTILSRSIENLLDRPVYSSENALKLPNNFTWVKFDLNSDEELSNVEKFLQKHYYKNDSNFSVKYTCDMLRWILYKTGALLGIAHNGELCGIVGYKLKNVTVFDKVETMLDVNFLCVIPKLRGKGMTGVLIDEMVRQVCKSCTSGVFFTETRVPSPTTSIRFYRRPFNYAKLNRLGFMNIAEINENDGQKFFEVTGKSEQCRLATEDDYQIVYDLYRKEMTSYNIHENHTLEAFLHYFFDNPFMKTYVMTNKKGEIVDFFSFYLSHYNVKDSSETISNAQLHTYSLNKFCVDDVFDNLINILYELKVDLLTVNDTMQNRKALLLDDKFAVDSENSDEDKKDKTHQHKFLKSSQKLYLNFFNWECSRILPSQLSMSGF